MPEVDNRVAVLLNAFSVRPFFGSEIIGCVIVIGKKRFFHRFFVKLSRHIRDNFTGLFVKEGIIHIFVFAERTFLPLRRIGKIGIAVVVFKPRIAGQIGNRTYRLHRQRIPVVKIFTVALCVTDIHGGVTVFRKF